MPAFLDIATIPGQRPAWLYRIIRESPSITCVVAAGQELQKQHAALVAAGNTDRAAGVEEAILGIYHDRLVDMCARTKLHNTLLAAETKRMAAR